MEESEGPGTFDTTFVTPTPTLLSFTLPFRLPERIP